jgi:hypothetical protein
MRTSSVQEIKEELQRLKTNELISICQRLARFKKENKELLSYLLFDAHNEEGFVQSVKDDLSELFDEINVSQLYFAKKSLRKIVRLINKFSRYSGNKQTEVELRIFFCRKLQDSDIPFHRNPVIVNLYDGQLKKINILLQGLHEDLQHDYRKEMKGLEQKEERSASWFSFGRKSSRKKS